MNKTEMIRELRALTQAGMKDCKDALEESAFDLQKAVDLVKTKGLNIVSGREGKVAAEGRVAKSYWRSEKCMVMVEVNCQTDFVAASPEFSTFVENVSNMLCMYHDMDKPFDPKTVGVKPNLEDERLALIAKTKENIIIRRWWVEEVFDDSCRVFGYSHPNPKNAKIGVMLSLKAPNKDVASSSEFASFAMDIAMQIAAMSPVAVSVDRLPAEAVARQQAIFEAQLAELNKPQAAWAKILDGKFNKWYTEVCLMNQEFVVAPKTTVQQVIKNMETKFGGEIQVINFIRCQVGEGIEQEQKVSLAEEVSKMSGVESASALRDYYDVLKG